MSRKNKNFVKGIIVILCLCIIAGVVAFHYLMPKIMLYQRQLSINIYSDYIENNYKATYLNKDISDEVKIEGVVDTNNFGSYKINYNLKHNIFNVKKEAIVNVVDTIAPTIELKGDKEFKVCSINSFEDPGYLVYDNYDNDLEDKVESKVSENKVIYEVKDSHNNIGRNIRNLIVTDDEKPKITLNGSSTIYVLLNNNYEEKGANASDNCDKDITDKIKISGEVDTTKTGTYEINYEVSDLTGNTSNIKRKVVVTENKITNNDSGNATGGIIYLTFDDGPGAGTESILNTLKQYDIKATFFVTMSGSDELLKREALEGHTIALHTATHNYKTIYASVDAYFNDLNTVSNRVKNVTGIESKYVRFPGGSSNRVSKVCMSVLANELANKGYKYYDWNVDVNDAGSCASSKDPTNCVLNNFKKGLYAGRSNMVLMHDIKSYTAKALPSMIEYAKDRGFTFKAIDDDAITAHHGTKC